LQVFSRFYSNNPRHNVKKFRRSIIAGILTAIYFAISVSSLAPLALGSASAAHATAGECSGNCEIDGCSPESRAAHTCCCWQKKIKELEEKKHGGCCGKKSQQRAKTVLKCNCPCGKGMPLALFNAEKFEQLLCRFTAADVIPLEGQLTFLYHPRMITRSTEPFTPPPEHTLFS